MMTHLAKETRQQKELGGRKQCRQNLKKKRRSRNPLSTMSDAGSFEQASVP